MNTAPKFRLLKTIQAFATRDRNAIVDSGIDLLGGLGIVRATSLRGILLAASLAVVGASPLHAQQVYLPYHVTPVASHPWAEGWAGFGVTNNWYGGYIGGNYALNAQRDVWADGVVLRVDGFGGHYDYTTMFVPGGRANVTYGGGDFMVGYRKVIPGFFQTTTLTGYVGAEVQDHQNPDPTADVRGTEWGVKVIGDMYSRINQYQDLFAMVSLSTAFDTWLLLARPGFMVTAPGSTVQLWVGPDMSVFGAGHGWVKDASSCPIIPGGVGATGTLGSCKYDEGRIGGFLHIVIPNQPIFGDWLIAGGYRKPLIGTAADGYYAQIGLYFRLQ